MYAIYVKVSNLTSVVLELIKFRVTPGAQAHTGMVVWKAAGLYCTLPEAFRETRNHGVLEFRPIKKHGPISRKFWRAFTYRIRSEANPTVIAYVRSNVPTSDAAIHKFWYGSLRHLTFTTRRSSSP